MSALFQVLFPRNFTVGAMRQVGMSFVVAIGALSLAACSSGKLLPRATDASPTAFQTYEEVEAAYSSVVPGKTTVADLSKLGFDVKATNIEVLSSVDIQARLPQATNASGRLPPQLQMCIDTQDHCAAYLFRPSRVETRHVGNTALELGGFEHKTVNAGWSADVVLAIHNDVVVYKLMSGKPNIEETRTVTQPLGPIQNEGALLPKADPPSDDGH